MYSRSQIRESFLLKKLEQKVTVATLLTYNSIPETISVNDDAMPVTRPIGI